MTNITFPTPRQRFHLFLRPGASPELTAAHKAYVKAMEDSWVAAGEDVLAAWAAVEAAHKAYGKELLRADRAARPEFYAAA